MELLADGTHESMGSPSVGDTAPESVVHGSPMGIQAPEQEAEAAPPPSPPSSETLYSSCRLTITALSPLTSQPWRITSTHLGDLALFSPNFDRLNAVRWTPRLAHSLSTVYSVRPARRVL